MPSFGSSQYRGMSMTKYYLTQKVSYWLLLIMFKEFIFSPKETPPVCGMVG